MIQHSIYYLAYGSNLHPHRLRLRVPSSEAVGIATLSGYRLLFHKSGRDGSGKCNVLQTQNPDDSVIGVVYQMLAAERHLLDTAEGLGRGYELGSALLTVDSIEYDTFFYVAEPDHINDDLRPYSWYKQLVLEGARGHGLPADYIDAIARITDLPDPDANRHAHHEAILRGTIP